MDIYKDPQKLKDHPEVKNNCKDVFNYEKNPVIEDSMPSGYDKEKPVFADDITDKNIEKIVDFALKYVDGYLLAAGDIDDAAASSIQMSLQMFEDGKWHHKVDANTLMILENLLKKKLTPAKIKTIENSSSETKTAGQKGKGCGKGCGKVEQISEKGKVTNIPKGLVNKAIRSKTKSPSAMHNMKKVLNNGGVLVLADVIDRLDKVASILESKGRVILAEQLDMVSNTLEKENKNEENS